MEDPELKIYLQFMATFLKKFNELSERFQRETSQIFSILDEIRKFFVVLAHNIL